MICDHHTFLAIRVHLSVIINTPLLHNNKMINLRYYRGRELTHTNSNQLVFHYHLLHARKYHQNVSTLYEICPVLPLPKSYLQQRINWMVGQSRMSVSSYCRGGGTRMKKGDPLFRNVILYYHNVFHISFSFACLSFYFVIFNDGWFNLILCG